MPEKLKEEVQVINKDIKLVVCSPPIGRLCTFPININSPYIFTDVLLKPIKYCVPSQPILTHNCKIWKDNVILLFKTDVYIYHYVYLQ